MLALASLLIAAVPLLDGKVVVILGDSLTAGEGVPPHSSFVGLLRERHPGVQLVVQGRSGWSTASYLRRIGEVLPRVPQEAGTVVVLLGSNDLRERGHSDETVASTVANVSVLFDRVRARAPSAKRVLVSPPLVHPRFLSPRMRQAGFGEQSPDYLRKLRDAYRAFAARRRIGFVDLSAALPEAATLDGAHPTADGHAAIARALEAGLGLGEHAAPRVRHR